MCVATLGKLAEKVCATLDPPPIEGVRREASHVGQVCSVGSIALKEGKKLAPEREQLTEVRPCLCES